MRRAVREVQKERPARVALDEPHRPVGVARHQRRLRRAGQRLADCGLALDEPQRRVELRRLRVPGPHVVRVGESEELVEPLARRQVVRAVAEVPLADRRGRVAPGFEHFRERGLAGREAAGVLRPQRPRDADAVRVAAREDRRPARAAHGLRDVEVGEAHPLTRQAVEVRRADRLRPVTAEVAVTQVVGDDQHHVRRLGPRGHRGERDQDRENDFHPVECNRPASRGPPESRRRR